MSSINPVRCSITTAGELVLVESDTQLLRTFVAEGTDAVFEELMRRHGPMVMGVCRRVLPECHDAEDAYQTTFLLLVQKSATIRRPERLASWLFGVAYRVATRIRTKAGKQESLRMQALEALVEDNTIDVAQRELECVLDEELHRLPESHRLPLILCYLEGKTHVEAARDLGWPSGSMSSRLTQARAKLRRRLARRGLTFASALFGLLLGNRTWGGELSPALMQQTTRPARACANGEPLSAEVVSARVARLLAEMNKCLLAAKVRELTVLVILLLLLLLSTGNAVRVVHGQMKARAERRGETVPSPLMWIVRSSGSALVSLTRLRSAAGAWSEAGGTSRASASSATTSGCGAH